MTETEKPRRTRRFAALKQREYHDQMNQPLTEWKRKFLEEIEEKEYDKRVSRDWNYDRVDYSTAVTEGDAVMLREMKRERRFLELCRVPPEEIQERLTEYQEVLRRQVFGEHEQ